MAGIFPGLDVDRCDTLPNVIPPQAAAAKGIVFPGVPDEQEVCVIGEEIRAVPIAGETTVPM